MAKLDMIFVVGSAVARARVQRRLTQQDLAAAYKQFLEGHLDEYPSASFLDNGRISSIEGSRPGQVVGPRPETDPRHYPADPNNENWSAPSTKSIKNLKDND